MTDYAEALARIRETADRRERLIDAIVDDLLEKPGAEIWSRMVADIWQVYDLEDWHTLRYAMSFVSSWLRAAEERGELTSELRLPTVGPRFARRYYWRST